MMSLPTKVMMRMLLLLLLRRVRPPRKNRKTASEYDEHLYSERNLVERVFQKLKDYRRIATRYERLATTYLAMLSLVATISGLIEKTP